MLVKFSKQSLFFSDSLYIFKIQDNRYIGECSHSNSKDQYGDQEQSPEVVVEDYPGVYLHILRLPDGTKELTRIQFR